MRLDKVLVQANQQRPQLAHTTYSFLVFLKEQIMASQELWMRVGNYKYYKHYIYSQYTDKDRCKQAFERVKQNHIMYDKFSINSYKKLDNPKYPIEKQRLHARVTRALSFLYGNTLKSRCVATVICGLMPKMAVSHDNPNSNVSYSRNGVSYKNHKKRTTLKFSRFLARYYPNKFTDQELEKLQMAYEYETPYIKKVLEGEEALAIYKNATSEDFTSCMTGSKSYLLEDHFLQNTEKLKLVVLYLGNKIVARAKLWTNDDGTLFLDSVYVRKGIPNLTEDHATSIISKDYELVDYYDITLYSPPGTMPYMDSPDHFDRRGNYVRFHKLGEYEACSSDGIDESSCCRCAKCDEAVEDTTEYDGEDLCESCAEYFCEEHTEIDGRWYSNDDIIYDDEDSEWILLEDSVQIYGTGSHTKKSNCTELDTPYYPRNSYALDSDTIETHDGYTILEEESVEHLGKIYHESDELPEEVVDETLQTVE